MVLKLKSIAWTAEKASRYQDFWLIWLFFVPGPFIESQIANVRAVKHGPPNVTAMTTLPNIAVEFCSARLYISNVLSDAQPGTQ